MDFHHRLSEDALDEVVWTKDIALHDTVIRPRLVKEETGQRSTLNVINEDLVSLDFIKGSIEKKGESVFLFAQKMTKTPEKI